MQEITIDFDEILEQKFEEFNIKLMHPIEDQKNELMIVHDLIFPDSSCGTLNGYNRGIGQFFIQLEAWEVPVGVYTDTGDYYHSIFDAMDLEKRPTFRIGDTEYFNRIIHCLTSCYKVDPKTGNLIVG